MKSDTSLLTVSSLMVSSTKKFLVSGTLHFGAQSSSHSLFLDCGADDNFISPDLVASLKIPTVPLSQPVSIRLADGKSPAFGSVLFESVPLQLHIGSHIETIKFFVAPLSHELTLGYSWLATHNPSVDWCARSLTFHSAYCLESCVSVSTTILSASSLSLSPRPSSSLSLSSSSSLSLSPRSLPPRASSPRSLSPRVLSPRSLSPRVLSPRSLSPRVLSSSPPSAPETSSLLPSDIADFSDVFAKTGADQLPPHRIYDCAVDLRPGATPPTGRAYNLTVAEDTAMQEWLQDNLSRGFIRKSSSPYAAPCFFVKKKDASLRLCMDYRKLNAITIKDRNPIPLISDLIRTLSRGKIFTTLDLRGAYNLLRMRSGDESKTAFVTKHGQYEFLVMPFGLANAPAQFQTMMNALFSQSIGKYVLVYLDDIVIYSQTMAEHWVQVRAVLQILRDQRLFCKLEKCHFAQTRISYLGYIITPDSVAMDPAKVATILEWPQPQSAHDIQVFLGFTNFYRRFIDRYSVLTQPLTALLRKDVPFVWSREVHSAWTCLKDAFRAPDFLLHPDDSKPFIVECDASDFAVGGVLSQYDASDTLRPVAFYSRQMLPAERNYEIYDKELLAIFACFQQWRHFLQGGKHQVTVLTEP